MSLQIKTTGLDHIPEDFTLESLAQTLTQGEIDALTAGDDPIVGSEQQADPAAAAEADAAALAAAQDAEQERNAQVQNAAAPIAVPDTTEAEAAVARIDTALDALTDRYDLGEMTKAEMVAEQKRLIQEQARAQAQLDAAALAIEQNRATFRDMWFNKLETYKAKAGFLWEAEHLAGWDAALRTVTGSAAYAELPLDRKIELAHDMYAANYKATSGKPLPVPKAADTPPGEVPKTARTDDRDPVQTLANFNTDTAAAIDDGTFAVIDRTMAENPLAAEKLFLRLTPDQQQAYLNA